jgi:hypothetical protein
MFLEVNMTRRVGTKGVGHSTTRKKKRAKNIMNIASEYWNGKEEERRKRKIRILRGDNLNSYTIQCINKWSSTGNVTILIQVNKSFAFACFDSHWPQSEGLANTIKKLLSIRCLSIGCYYSTCIVKGLK